MNGIEFKSWRRELGLSQRFAAKLLILPEQTIQGYECEYQQQIGVPAQIPKVVEMSCRILRLQIRIFQMLRRVEAASLQSCKESSSRTDPHIQRLLQKLGIFSLRYRCAASVDFSGFSS